MTHRQVLALGRTILRRAGYGDQQIGTVLPFWADGFKRGVRSTRAKAKKERR
jgi:hypothetical protein